LWIEETEGARFWLKVFNDLKARGVQDILVLCGDGLTGLPDAVRTVYPQADVQLCVVHPIRNATKFVSSRIAKRSAPRCGPSTPPPPAKPPRSLSNDLSKHGAPVTPCL
jgi:putative transposase